MPRSLQAKRFGSMLAPFVLEFARRAGHDPKCIEERFLSARKPGGAAGAEIGLPALDALMSECASLIGSPFLGIHLAQSMGRGTYGLMEFAVRSASSGRVALEQLVRYGALINPLLRWSLEAQGAELELHLRAPLKGGAGRQHNYFSVARVLTIAREMLGSDVSPVRAWFAHRERGCPQELADFLQTDQVSFGRASNGIALSTSLLERVPVDADPELNRALERHCAELLASRNGTDVYESTRAAIRELLPRGDATLARAARRLHVTPRTLQRRLTAEGLSFAAVLDEVRRGEAERLLTQGDAPLAAVAEQLGYGDAGAFVRAFRRWTGTTPGQFRDALPAARPVAERSAGAATV